jgi:hypothetical protein
MATTSPPPAVERIHPPDVLVRAINPLMRRLLTSPLHRVVSGQLMLLRYRGRRSGRAFALPLGRQEHRGHVAAFTNSTWRHNFRGGHDAELVLAGTPQPVRGDLVEDVGEVTSVYAARIEELGWQAAQRRLGLRITVGRTPTRDELAGTIRASGLSIVVFEPVRVSTSGR